MNCQSLVCIEDLLPREQLQELLKPCLSGSTAKRQWLVLAINFMFKSFIEQKLSAVTKLMKTTPTPSEASTPKATKTNAKQQISQSGPNVGQTPKEEQIKKMHEAMSQKFFEITEASKYNASAPSKNADADSYVTDKEMEASLSPTDCAVVHVVENNFCRILECAVLNARKRIREKKIEITPKIAHQKVYVADSVQFIKETQAMQLSSLSYLISVVLDIISNGVCKINSSMPQQLLCLLEMVQQHNLMLSVELCDRLEKSTISMLQVSSSQIDTTTSSLLQQLVSVLLQVTTNPSCLAMGLLQIEMKQAQPNESLQVNVSLVCLKRLMQKDCLMDDERSLLKQLFACHIMRE